ncbi:hypothetical protein [uncultured Sutterella sp.]|uniref:hypothetical protein n=1 Tax=uncultured Sutterella sp. TaxID=286133 RepID=UPI0025EBD899|nr:hypothetical protein [uncultured Sutterella sp.]
MKPLRGMILADTPSTIGAQECICVCMDARLIEKLQKCAVLLHTTPQGLIRSLIEAYEPTKDYQDHQDYLEESKNDLPQFYVRSLLAVGAPTGTASF